MTAKVDYDFKNRDINYNYSRIYEMIKEIKIKVIKVN